MGIYDLFVFLLLAYCGGVTILGLDSLEDHIRQLYAKAVRAPDDELGPTI